MDSLLSDKAKFAAILKSSQSVYGVTNRRFLQTKLQLQEQSEEDKYKLFFKKKLAIFQHLTKVGCFLLSESTVATETEISVAVLTLKAPPIICSRRQFQILPLFQK